MNKIHLVCLLALLASTTGLASQVDDLNKAYTMSYQNIFGTGLMFSGWEKGNQTKTLTACGLIATNEAHYSAASSLSMASGLVTLDQKKLKEMEIGMQKLFDSFEDDKTKEGWFKISSSFTRILSKNSDDNYVEYHLVNGLRNAIALTENGCLEKYSKMPLVQLNKALDEKGKLGSAKLGDTITHYANFGGNDNYGAIVDDTTKAVYPKEFSWFLTRTENNRESYLGNNQFIAKSDLKYYEGIRYRAKDLEIGKFQFYEPVAYISPSTNRVYAIEMKGKSQSENTKELNEILSSAYGNYQVNNIWFSSTRILYNDNGSLLMIDIPLYREHIKWVEATRSKNSEASKAQKDAKKKEAVNFFQ